MPQQVAPGLLSWASDIEPGTIEQAARTARLPFVRGHVALMPDAHVGIGATVGSVIPTTGAIVPAAVGVDIGCFRGDTRVPLLNGTQKSLRDMADGGGAYWVYSLDSGGAVVPGKATALKTREDAGLMCVIVSGGDEIICTPDHPFMMNDGTYREARELRFNDSLMPLPVHHREVDRDHQVIAVEQLTERADVYCLQVEEHHNFALAAGVFVHNCGMVASRTTLTAADLPDDLSALMPLVEQRIPAGIGQGHDDPVTDAALGGLGEPATVLNSKQLITTGCQFGTLGSGNHYVEVCLDERDRVWTVLHSGSRGIGNQLARKHISGAKKLMKQWFIELEDPDLAYLVQGTPEFTAYIRDMLWCQRYAMASRAAMNDAITRSLFEVAGAGETTQVINCHHNFTVSEHHHGRDMWITRKGAIKAADGDLGIVPGSMATGTYIVSGLGSAASYNSCSHGAGRRMSRGQARRDLTPQSLTAAMAGRTWNADRAAELVDEHPLAYKDVAQVMADQSDLAAIEHTLRQVFNYKG
jgi:RNA-splicing ligase RtcB